MTTDAPPLTPASANMLAFADAFFAIHGPDAAAFFAGRLLHRVATTPVPEGMPEQVEKLRAACEAGHRALTNTAESKIVLAPPGMRV